MKLAAGLLVLTLGVAGSAAAQALAPPPLDYLRFEDLRSRDRVESDGRMERAQDIRVVLRDAAAIAELGQIAIPYVEGYGDVAFETVRITKPDGRVVDVANALVEDVNPFGLSGSSVAADVRFKKITIPGLEPGDTLAIRWVIRMKPLAPGRVFGEMKFVGAVSDPLQVYELDLPRDKAIAVEVDEGTGATWENVPAPEDRLVRRLSVRPKRLEEGATDAQVEALQRPDVAFSSFRTWAEVGQWWWTLSRERLVPNAVVRAEAARIVGPKKDPREILAALHAFVAGRIRYLNVSFGIGRMQPRPAADVLESKYGDCKDKVALLAALASAAGIDIRPVLVHSGRKTLRDAVAGPQQFDHMIAVAQLGGSEKDWLWLDATNDMAPAGYLMPALRDKAALMIDRTGTGVIVRTPVRPPFTQRIDIDMKGALQPDGVVKAHLRLTFRSENEAQMRLAYRTTPQDRYPEMIAKSLLTKWKDAKVTNVTMSDPSDVKDPFRVEFDAEGEMPERSSENEWALSMPLPEIGLPAGRKGASGDDKIAEFAVDEVESHARIDLPPGAAARAPVAVSIDRPFAQLRSVYSVEGGALSAHRRLITLKRTVTAPDSTIYESFRQAVEKDRAQSFWIQSGGDAAANPPSAAVLHKDGLAALAKKDYARAIVAFEKAVAADPKLADGYNDLGRALREVGRREDAIKAFAREIESNPFHESAYAERAYTLLDLGRAREAEKDMLKQIEVAPLKPWSYERLARMRMEDQRFADAARYYAGAASLEPKKAENWVELGWAHALAEDLPKALLAFARARTLTLEDWTTVRVALGYVAAGDVKTGGALAEQVVGGLAERLATLSTADFDRDDVYWTDRLLDAWQVIGLSAAETGDIPRAARYLESAWHGGFNPFAGVALGDVREKQKRPADAARLWKAVAAMMGRVTLPPTFAKRLAAAAARTDRSEGVALLMEQRTLTLPGAAADDFTSNIVVLVGPKGRIEGVKNLSPANKAAFERVRPRVVGTSMPFSAPDDRPAKLVREGILVCNRLTSCAIVLDIPGTDTPR